jgi:leucyl/phenylalanyl-tRNA--protein transferase
VNPVFDEDLRAVGGRLPEPEAVMAAYRVGLFPMGLGEGGGPPVGWWAPVARGVLLPGDLRVSRSLRRSMRGFDCAVDTRFAEVVDGCADPHRDGAWITPAMRRLYLDLHAAGHAHSVEVMQEGELVGGLFGISFGRVFVGESMFHRRTDASKAALVALVRLLDAGGPTWLLDVQWITPHLASLGVSELSGFDYAVRLQHAGGLDPGEVFSRAARTDVNFYAM